MNNRIFAILLSLTLVLALAACAPSGPEPGTEPETLPPVEEPVEPELPNPMEEVSELNFDEKLGWSINGWPADYTIDHAFIIAGAVAEVDFTTNGNAAAFRVAAESEGDISGVYDSFTDSETAELGDAQIGMKWTQDETGLAIWYKDGYVQTLYMKSGASLDNLLEIAEKIDGNVTIGDWVGK